MVFRRIGFPGQDGKINDPLIQLFCYLFCIAAYDVVMQIGISILERSDCGRQMPYLIRLCQAEVNIPAQNIVQCVEFLRNFVGHFDQIFCPLPQQDPLLGEPYAETVTREQLFRVT